MDGNTPRFFLQEMDEKYKIKDEKYRIKDESCPGSIACKFEFNWSVFISLVVAYLIVS